MSTDSDFEGVVLNTVTTMVPDTTQENEDDLDIIYSNERKHFSTKVGFKDGIHNVIRLNL